MQRRHCEEGSDEAIQNSAQAAVDCFADDRNDANEIVLATLTRPSLAHHHNAKKKIRFLQSKGSGAPKGACHPCPRYRKQVYAVCATYLLRGCASPECGAPAFRRSRLRHSPPAITRWLSSRTGFSRRRTSRVFCPLGPFCLRLSTHRPSPLSVRNCNGDDCQGRVANMAINSLPLFPTTLELPLP